MSILIHPTQRTGSPRRGFTLLESLIAAAILMGIVVAVTSAVVAGQQNALEAHMRVAGALASEAMMSRLSTVSYDRLTTFNGLTEAVGEMEDEHGDPMPETFGAVGRRVTVTSAYHTLTPPGATVYGRLVSVETFDADGRILAEIQRFFVEPASS